MTKFGMRSVGNLLQSLSAQVATQIGFQLNPELAQREVTRVTSDSREIVPGAIFVAIQGQIQDGHEFISVAEKNGALIILGEKDLPPQSLKTPYIKVEDGRLALAQLAATFYGNPSQSLLMIGVTGTSGKTTTTYLIESILKAAGYQVGLIGTVNFRFGSKIFPSTHTTPGPVELQSLLFQMKAEGCTAVVMEVSSHALKQKRVASIAFDGMVFTNLSPEHLDFHPDMEDYFFSKASLFNEYVNYSITQGKKPVGIINGQDSYGNRLLSELKSSQFTSFQSADRVQMTLQGITGDLNGVKLQSQLTGLFNVSNISGAVSLAQKLGISNLLISQGITDLKGVPGRLERVQNNHGIYVWVDYAHKADALEKVVKTLREIREGHRLITVFGCGGDRDRQKRPVMGKIAVEWSDWVFVTSDNPRTEEPNSIIQEILKGTSGFENFTVEVDRREAIFKAIRFAKKGDLVLIAGKGHEDYQVLGKKKIHFDDREVVFDAFNSI